ncbi:MAG: hypothetical protein JW995_11580 [Melioribacteraceae bacterium]|nr:hypothetical protein [Melioribacteraceae bacterium]
MLKYSFGSFKSDDWIDTKSTIQKYCHVLTDFKSKFSAYDNSLKEQALSFYAKGLTTSPVPVMAGEEFKPIDLNLNFYEHKLKIFCGEARLSVFLENQSMYSFAEEVITIMNGLGIGCECDFNKFGDETMLTYSEELAFKFWENLYKIYFLLLQFKSGLQNVTSEIKFFTSEFKASSVIYNNEAGKPGFFNIGFSFDGLITDEPCFYFEYPANIGIEKNNLPADTFLYNDNTAVLIYNSLAGIENPDKKVLEFFNSAL